MAWKPGTGVPVSSILVAALKSIFFSTDSGDLKDEDLEKAAVALKDKVVALEDQLNRFPF